MREQTVDPRPIQVQRPQVPDPESVHETFLWEGIFTLDSQRVPGPRRVADGSVGEHYSVTLPSLDFRRS